MNLDKLFIEHCKDKNLEINQNQKRIIELINIFYKSNFIKRSFLNIFSKKSEKLGFYLQGDVGVGKTMILNFFYGKFNKQKQRLHFNEFMISFHNFLFKNKNNKKKILLINSSTN